MEKIEIPIENEDQMPEESKEVINPVTTNTTTNIEEINGDVQTTEKPIEEEDIEKNDDDEVVPSTTPKPIEEQENVTETTTTVSASVSPGRANAPFKEVNESDKESGPTLVNGTENINNKKRELDNGDEQVQEKILANDERVGDQTKKIKITESTDTITPETKESGNNGITTVEV